LAAVQLLCHFTYDLAHARRAHPEFAPGTMQGRTSQPVQPAISSYHSGLGVAAKHGQQLGFQREAGRAIAAVSRD
jgi:hypothetical protein